MRYATLGQTGLKASRLGFGCMRLPMTTDGKVDRDLAIPMLRRAVDLGITYFDTAIFYCNGDSQRALGEAMKGMRDRVILSTKNHLYDAADDAWWGRLEESLDFLQTDHIDCYNLHGITWDAYQNHGIGPAGKLRLMEKAKAQGKIRHICCSFHDTPEALVKLIETRTFASITLQYNLLNRGLEKALYRAQELGVGIVVMGPVGGGRLGVQSERIRELTGRQVDSTPEAAIRFVLAHPAVTVALSGMSTMEMLDQNVRIVSEKEPFTAVEIAAIDEEVKRVKSRQGVNCTACGYCQPCPFGVDIPGNFLVYNDYKLYGLTDHARAAYGGLADKGAACTECGACLAKCPQKIAIPDMLRRVMGELDTAHGDFGSLLAVSGVSAERLRVRLTVKNLRPEPIRPHVHVELEDGCACEPAVADFTEIGPSSSASGTLMVKAPDGVGVLRGRCVTMHENEARETAVRLPFFLIPSDAFRSHKAFLTAADFKGDEAVTGAHGYSVALRHDKKGIDIRVDVRSPMHALAKPGETTGARFELYADMRPPALRARDTYEDGVEQFILSLGEASFKAKSGKAYSLDMKVERTGQGCQMTLQLPFADFLQPDWPVPSTIGLDLMMVAHAADGTEYGHPTYGGRQGLWQHPKFFTRAYLL